MNNFLKEPITEGKVRFKILYNVTKPEDISLEDWGMKIYQEAISYNQKAAVQAYVDLHLKKILNEKLDGKLVLVYVPDEGDEPMTVTIHLRYATIAAFQKEHSGNLIEQQLLAVLASLEQHLEASNNLGL